MPDDEVTRDVGTTNIATVGDGPGALRTPTTFAAGSIVAGRYRLVALLGRGGMGDVYRAEDLTLDQPVALKFLPANVAGDPARLTAFHNELRTARQVSHKHVCRLHDLGEADGRRFLTMEYVDGEDLASLLRRVGRVPEERGIQMARQLCAGIVAAHEKGVVHRDLKPANVMIDSHGDVRITDFGIATAAGTADGAIVGTPLYMSPEQLAGKPASTAADIYALGLILFELFTGRRVIDAKTLNELRNFHQSGTLPAPSTIVRDLDPAIERVIMRCLDTDPARRPRSALSVAAALPGGDPLAAALAAGETPSPELLAAAGETEAIPVAIGLSLVGAIVAGLLLFFVVSSRVSIVGRVPLDLPPAVLVDRAQQTLASLGYTSPPGDSAFGFERDGAYLQWLPASAREGADDPIRKGNPSAVLFWYRTSPGELVPETEQRVTADDPALDQSGMTIVGMDTSGRLRRFFAVPPDRATETTSPVEAPWSQAFAAAGLDLAAFTPTPPQWTPPYYADSRGAWEGPLSAADSQKVRVEANAYQGGIVSFDVIGPWTAPPLAAPRRQSFADRVLLGTLAVFVCGLAVAAGLLARRNLRTNRADRRGAARLASVVAAAGVVSWLVGAHHSASPTTEYESLFRSGGAIALSTLMIWSLYLALEPYVRRFWPDSLLGWSRLVSGHIRDPRVGRDVLIGSALGVGVALVAVGRSTIIAWLGYQPPTALFGREPVGLAGAGDLISGWMNVLVSSVQTALLFLLVLVLVRLALRRVWAAAIVSVPLMSIPFLAQAGTTNTPLIYLFVLAAGAILTFVSFRFGLLALATALVVSTLLVVVPLRSDPSHWAASSGNWTLTMLIAVACLAFYASRAGQPLLSRTPEFTIRN